MYQATEIHAAHGTDESWVVATSRRTEMERRKRQKVGPSFSTLECSVMLEERQTIKRNGVDEYYRLK